MPIPFIDLASQQKRIRPMIDKAFANVLDSGQYIMGESVAQIEEKLSDYTQAKYVITCASGTSALTLSLMTQDLSRNDAVFVPSFTFIATAEAVLLAGGTPILVDSDNDTFNMSPASLQTAIENATAKGFNPKIIMPVDLFGLLADYNRIQFIADKYNMRVIADICQSFGGSYKDKKAGVFGKVSATSFFPAKPLGCYGEGGAIFTNDEEVLSLVRSFRSHGEGANRFENVRIGMNGRLDTLQAAVLLVKLTIFDDELEKRQVIASRYKEGLENVLFQVIPDDYTSSFAQFSLLTDKRDELQAHLKEVGIPSMIYYQRPIHLQESYKKYADFCDFSVANQLSRQIISLPMHPYLEEETQDFIINEVNKITTR